MDNKKNRSDSNEEFYIPGIGENSPVMNRIIKNRSGVYSFLRRREIVQPVMALYDYRRLVEKIHSEMQSAFAGVTDEEGLRLDSTEGVDKYLPDHLVHDLFSMYYKQNEELSLRPDFNRTKDKLLSEVVDHSLKIVTQQSYLSSYFFSKEISEYIMSMIQQMTEEDRDKCMSQLGGGGQDNDEDQDREAREILSKYLDRTKDQLEQAKKRAEKKSEKVEKLLGIGKDVSSVEYIDNIDNVMNKLSAIRLSNSQVSKFFEKLMKYGISNFNFKEEVYEESIFESDDIAELLDYDILSNPVLKKLMMEDICTEVREPRGKFVLYIDISGSMGSDQDADSLITIAKAVALKLFQMNLIKDVRYFTGKVYPPIEDKMDMLLFSEGGGTSFRAVVEDAVGLNAIVITDGQSHENDYVYNPNLYWVGVGGANFDCFTGKSKAYVTNKQCMLYDGTRMSYYTG